jgi:hypothetical protein
MKNGYGPSEIKDRSGRIKTEVSDKTNFDKKWKDHYI